MNTTKFVALAAAGLMVAGAASAQSRDQIQIVGSSTVFPFSTAVAERFGNTTDFNTPIVESTGSGGGFRLFCSGVGTEHPDITNASRGMKASEFETCQENGVTDVTQARIGFDGIVLANANSAPVYDLTIGQIWQALAADGPLPTMWNEIDPSLPAVAIEVFGPPPSSGTRDAFEELVMEEGCETVEGANCEDSAHIREDGVYVDAGENDNLIVSRLEANPQAIGIFGFSFLDQNTDAIHGSLIGGVEPTFDNIADGSYPVSRSLYFYIKNAHVGVVPGVQEFADLFMSENMVGEDGILLDIGLIPLPEEEYLDAQSVVNNLTVLTAADFE
ncbi:substrate-binding domain-containing protein [Pontivivens insulae]|uniref:Phosphate-binding protein PstS n=1 Tax=Pontivivens insulae TaxID=1639689 RepID=A0A2R8A7A2_9RHOB|nr:substrate-binding domain-containing protein [Pontivivens insulae]RED18168.1 phosphate ABC transporter substrate-binding protein (PhoT family) [Pontivivens insulae]SPF28065.1 Phosphate-binding protein PstS [Pontivivens insulae]